MPWLFDRDDRVLPQPIGPAVLDQFNLLYGARRFVRRLHQSGVTHRYAEFSDNHTGVDYRMDESLPFLAQALSCALGTDQQETRSDDSTSIIRQIPTRLP